jgi:multidrug resistance efflux pump
MMTKAAYFEETKVGRIRDNDPVTVKLMGYSSPILGHVESLARGIDVANADPGPRGLASVNPIFPWVRLAQRIPMRVHIDSVPENIRLVAGMTATVQVRPRAADGEAGTSLMSVRGLRP